MSVVKGQDKIINFIDNHSIETFPQTLLLLGERGSGKHLIANYIKDRFKLEMIDITSGINQEFLDSIVEEVYPKFYLIDLQGVTERQQNLMLKLIEEPLKNSYIILLAEDTSRILSTVLNRCLLLQLQPYPRDFLREFLKDSTREDILSIAHTPGQVVELEGVELNKAVELSNLILDKLNVASFPNTLTISNRIAFGKEDSKMSLELFLDVFKYVMKSRVVDNKPFNYRLYELTTDLCKDLKYFNLNKKQLFENFLSNAWMEVRK